jgi:hypothetical protein
MQRESISILSILPRALGGALVISSRVPQGFHFGSLSHLHDAPTTGYRSGSAAENLAIKFTERIRRASLGRMR